MIMIQYQATNRRSTCARIVRRARQWVMAGGLMLAACAPSSPPTTDVVVTSIPPAPPPAVALPSQPITLDDADRLAPLARLGTEWVSKPRFSPDGRRLAVTTQLGVYVYDATQLSLQHALTPFNEEMVKDMDVQGVAFSPTGEALAVLVGSSGFTYENSKSVVVLLDAASGRGLRRFDNPTLTGYAWDIALAPGAERFAILLSQDKNSHQVAIIHAQSGHVERTIPVTFLGGLRFLADNRLLFLNGEDINLLDLASGKTQALGIERGLARFRVSANGERLAALMKDGTIRIYSVSSGKMDVLATVEAYRDANQPVREIELSPTGDRLAVGLSGGVVETWDIGEPTRRQHRIATGMPEWIEIWTGELALGAQAMFLVWPDNYIERWDLLDTTGPVRVQRLDHFAKYKQAAFGPDSDLLALGEPYGLVRLWRISEGRFVKTIGERLPPRRGRRWLGGLALSPNGALLALALEQTGPDDFFVESSTVSIWDVNSGRRLAEFQERGRQTVKGLAFSPDSATLVIHARHTEDAKDTIKLWRAADPRRLQTLARFEGKASGPVFSADSRALTILDGDSVTTWDVQRGAKLDSWQLPLERPDSSPFALARLPDDNTFIAVFQQLSSAVVVFDLARREVRSSSRLGRVYSLATSPLAGTALAIAEVEYDGRHPLLLFDPLNKGRFRYMGEGSSSFSSLAFSPDGKYILHVKEGIVTLWGARSP